MGWNAGVSSLQLGRAGSTVQARNPSDGTSEEPESVLRLLSHMTRESVSGEYMRQEREGVKVGLGRNFPSQRPQFLEMVSSPGPPYF